MRNSRLWIICALAVGLALFLIPGQGVTAEETQTDRVTVEGERQPGTRVSPPNAFPAPSTDDAVDPGLPQTELSNESVLKVEPQSQPERPLPTSQSSSGREKESSKMPWLILLIVGGIAAAAAS